MTRSHRPPRLARVGEITIPLALTGWTLATMVSQHPSKAFDRLRKYDATGVVLPNWRFFAPEPAKHDLRILYRVLTVTGEEQPWDELDPIAHRRWFHPLWFPRRRTHKAVSDLTGMFFASMGQVGLDPAESVPYRLLRDHIEHYVTAQERASDDRPRGFQFLLVRDTGYETDEDPDYLYASRFEAIEQRVAADDVWSSIDGERR
ncbi:hypothetical protein [Ilumatobacter nonamiensis]|uniref:hypothetical protein n=1 Tax=Ilumatobacter nonamiensis TaxID=467093 RepID=UPI00034ABDA2|nr:hypothetical protein [Ilumatobacter nonamiensis]